MHKQRGWFPLRLVFTSFITLVLFISGCAQPPTTTRPPAASPTATPQLGSPLVDYNGHTQKVTAVAWSPDGKHIASGSFDKTVQIWNADSGGHFQPFTYRGHSDNVLAVAWSPDGKRIASGSQDKTIQIWDAFDGEHVATYRGHNDAVTSLAWSPDGTKVASGSADGTARVWDVSSGQQKYIYRGHKGAISIVAWSPDGKRIASGSFDKTVQIFDSANGQTIYTYRGHKGTVSSLAWSPDGKRIASGSWDKTVQVWDSASGQVAYTYNGYNVEAARFDQTKGILPDVIYFVKWSHDGKHIAAVTQVYCGDVCDIVIFWDASNGGNIRNYQTLPMYAMDWSPDDTRLVESLTISTVRITWAI